MNFKRDAVSKKHLILLGIALLLLIWLIQHYSAKKPLQVPLLPVVVQQPILQNMVDYISQTGTTVAFNAVNLVARVEGYLNAIEFTDGSFVEKNRQLFVIQPEPYWEQLKAAQATVAAQKADYAYSKIEYARQQRMYKENATSLNNVEKWLAKMQASAAELAKDVANEEIAKINYSYTHILAPFKGRIGRHLVDAGNLVGNGKATDLATIEQIDTLYVYFNLNEIELIKLREAARAKGFKPGDINKITVDISLQTETSYKHKASLDFVNTGLNAATGTMELRAVLDNKNYALVPGLFVQVRIPISQPTKQLTVPDTALQYDQIGPYLFTVNASNVVEVKRVSLGSLNQGMRAIIKGISATDKVVVEGLQNASPGNKVEVRTLSQTGKTTA